MDVTKLTECGVDYERGLARCMGDEEFYVEMLSLFLQDDTFQRAKAAYEGGDAGTLFKTLHELKGACGNAAMTALYQAVFPLVELLRSEDFDMDQVDAMFAQVEEAYLKARKGVSWALGELRP